MKTNPNVRFVTATDFLRIYDSPLPRVTDRRAVAQALSREITFAQIQGKVQSPADMLLVLLGLDPAVVDGPTSEGTTSYKQATIEPRTFERTAADVADFVRRHHRLPNNAFVGPETLSLADFAATLAGSVLNPGADVTVQHGNIQFEGYFAKDPHKPFDWVIHPEGFDGSRLLELGRLQGWTLKPATLVK
jgi:hypothetical protein